MLLLTCFASPAAAQEIKVTAEPSVTTRPTRVLPTCNITIENGSAVPIETIDLRNEAGGPTIRRGILVPPQSKQTVEVELPAILPHETYRLSLGRGGQVAHEQAIALDWPAAQIDAAREAIIQPYAFGPYDKHIPQWPAATRQTLLMIFIVTAVLLAGTLWLRRPAAKLIAVAVVIAAATAGAGAAIASVPVVEDLAQISPASPVTAFAAKSQALSARRHAEAVVTGDFLPVYRSTAQLQADTAVMEPGKVTVQLAPGEIRLFHQQRP